MAHRFKVEVVPGTNKDGSTSKTKKIYRLIDSTRRRRFRLAECTHKSEVPEMIEMARAEVIRLHLAKHPNDMAFRRKHGLA